MTEMELTSTIEPILEYQPAVISLQNSELLKRYVSDQVNKYKDLLITDDSLIEAKKSRAELNKLNKALSTQRISISKEILKPFSDIEALLKSLESQTKTASRSIDAGVKDLEERQRLERESNLKAYLAETIMHYPELETSELNIPVEWTNKSNFTATMKLTTALTKTIADALETLAKQKKTAASNAETVRSYAQAKQVNPDPYLRMLQDFDYQPSDVFRAIDLDIENAKKKEAQDKIDAEFQAAQQKSHEQVINNVVVDTETGEAIKAIERSDNWYYLIALTEKDKDKLDNFLIINQLKVLGTQKKAQS